jgi:retron-type reverse transcriptase
LEFLQGIIDNNIFQAGNQFFHQKIGLPMGGSLSPSLANIYLGVLERKIISQYSPPILFYRRYMDDLLFILINNPPFIDTF